MHSSKPAYRYQAGGTLRDNAPYVYRDADETLYAELIRGEFCYVFNCRQMGKSSLRAKTMRRLMSKGIGCVSVDLTTIGTQVSTEQWYSDFIDALHDHFTILLETGQLANSDQFDLDSWHQHYQELKQEPRVSPVRRCNRYFKEILLGHLQNQSIVIFIDEIDAVLNLEFDASDFFALIRACFNQRPDHPDYKRLTFALFGVATPAQLIRDPYKTPFNLGKDVVLTGFQFERSLILSEGLVDVVSNPQAVLREILEWTGGQPFLTQKLCDWVQRGIPDMPPLLEGAESIWVERLVRSHIVENWESQDQPQHLITIYRRLMHDESRAGRLLGLYQEILQKGEVSTDGDDVETDLCLSGLVVRHQGRLRVYNRIYAEVFNQQWIDDEFLKLRPTFYAKALERWETSGFQRNSQYLLLAEELEEALIWEKERKLSDIDYRFLRACQEYESNLQREANKILDDARNQANMELDEASKNLTKAKRDRKKARRSFRLSLIFLVICVCIAVFIGLRLWQQQQIAKFEASSAASLSRAEISPKAALKEVLDYVQQDGHWRNESRISDYPIKNLSLALQKIVDKAIPSGEVRTFQEGVNSINFLKDNNNVFITAGQNATLVKWVVPKNQTNPEKTVFTYYEGSSINSFRLEEDRIDAKTRLVLGTDSGEALVFSSSVLKTKEKVDLSKARKVYLWDREVSSGEEKIAHKDGVFNIRISSNNQNKVVITGGKSDGYLKLWNLSDSLDASSDQWVEKTWGREAHVITNKDGRKVGGIRSIDFNKDGNRIISGGVDGTAKLWDLQGRNLCTFNHYSTQSNVERWIYSVLFIKDGEADRAVTGGQDGFVKIWTLDEEGCKLSESINTGIDGVGVVRFNPKDLQQFAVASRANISSGAGSPVRVWDRRGNLLAEFRGHEGVVPTLRYIEDGNKIVTGGQNDGNVFVWDVSSLSLKNLSDTSEEREKRKALYSIRFCNADICDESSRDRYVATAGQGKLALWELTGASDQDLSPPNFVNDSQYKTHLTKNIWEKTDDKTKLRTVRFFNRNGEVLIAAAGDDGKVRFWNLKGEERGELRQGGNDDIESISFNEDKNGKYLAIVGADGLFEVWELSNNSERVSGNLFFANNSLKGFTIRAVRWSKESNDSQKVAAVGDNFTLAVLNLKKEIIARSQDFADFINEKNLDQMPLYSISFEDDDSIRVAGANGKVYTLELLHKEAQESFSSQSGIRNISFPRDKKLLATAGSGGNLSLWDSSSRQVGDLEGHRGIVRSVSFEELRRGEQWIFSAGDDGVPRAWRVRSISDLLRQACHKDQGQHTICEQFHLR